MSLPIEGTPEHAAAQAQAAQDLQHYWRDWQAQRRRAYYRAWRQAAQAEIRARRRGNYHPVWEDSNDDA